MAEEMAQRMSVLEQQVRAYRESSLLLSVSSSSSSGPSAATGGSQRRVGAVAEEEEEGAGEKEEEGAGGRESCSSARKIYQGRLEKRLKEVRETGDMRPEEVALEGVRSQRWELKRCYEGWLRVERVVGWAADGGPEAGGGGGAGTDEGQA